MRREFNTLVELVAFYNVLNRKYAQVARRMNDKLTFR